MSGLKSFFLLSFLVLLALLDAYPQNISNYRNSSMLINDFSYKIDSLPILPSSFSLVGLDTSEYNLDFNSATLFIHNDSSFGKIASFSYRLFTLGFTQTKYHKSLSLIQKRYPTYTPQIISISPFAVLSEQNEGYLMSTGSISRGVAVGNNQDIVLNSTLNLQLSGFLSENLEIMANITDRNIPIQPDGNTRVIQDFDKIFIRLNYKNRYLLNAGDIDVVKPYSDFLFLNKRLLGMEFSANNDFSNASLRNKVGGGFAKGKYVKKTINPINGVQGPYRLTGEQNETNIVILSGSEKVYLDGIPLQRGENYDYTIDYNTGEITFTPKVLITYEKRIIIEFEYRDNYYSRYTIYTFNEFNHEKNHKLKLNVNFYNEQDLKYRSLQPELSDNQMSFLSNIGDNIDQALYPNVDTAAFNNNIILYILKDTIVNGITYSGIYEYSTSRTEQLYRLSFSYVGNNGGNYILAQSTANGRLFQWVAPVNNIPQGNYEPVILLVTPKLMQLATLRAEYNFLKNSGIKTEFAFSNRDVNTFSSQDDDDNVGFAYNVQLFHSQQITKKTLPDDNWFFNGNISYEFVHKNFNPIESFREIEFSRNYNLPEEYSHHYSDHSALISCNFLNKKIGNVQYNLNYFSRSSFANILKNDLVASIHKNDYQYNTNNSYLISSDTLQNTNFLKSSHYLTKSFRKIEFGMNEILEYNAFKDRVGDTLLKNSYAFNEATLFFKNNDSLPYLYYFSFKNRIDNSAVHNVLSTYSIVNEVKSSFEIAQLKNNRFSGHLTYRNNQIKDSTNRYQSENYFVGTLEYTGRYFKNAIIISTRYEVGSGLELKQSFSFLKVADGQGTYTWNDYNGNGIEELDEFEVAVFQDEGNYIKVWNTMNDYVNTFNNEFSQTLQLRPANVWGNKQGFLKFLSRFSNHSNLRTLQKNNSNNWSEMLNPFHFNMTDTSLISSTVNFVNTFSFNQYAQYFGMDYVVRINRTKNLMYYGFETNNSEYQEVTARIKPHKSLTTKIIYQYNLKKVFSEYFASRQYELQTNMIKTIVLYQYKNTLFSEINWSYQQKRNLEGTEKSIQNNIELNVNYRIAKKGSINGYIKYVNIIYNDKSNSTISYEILEGLNEGHNGIWGLSYELNITENLQMSLLYEGRVTEENRSIHTGNIQIKAHF